MRKSALEHHTATPKCRATGNAAAAEMPLAEGAHHILNADLRHRMISETAYYLHAQRGYCDGYDMDDWMQAEAQIDHLVLGVRSAVGINASVPDLPSANSRT